MNEPSRSQSAPYGFCVSTLATMAPLASSIAVRATIRLRRAKAVISGSSVFGRCAGARKSAHHCSVAARCATGDSPRALRRRAYASSRVPATATSKTAVATP